MQKMAAASDIGKYYRYSGGFCAVGDGINTESAHFNHNYEYQRKTSSVNLCFFYSITVNVLSYQYPIYFVKY